jgi:hypothetical protein
MALMDTKITMALCLMEAARQAEGLQRLLKESTGQATVSTIPSLVLLGPGQILYGLKATTIS